MERNKEFYKRFIESCFARAAASTLPISSIRREARLVFTSTEIDDGLMPVLREMDEQGLVEVRESDQSVCLLEDRSVKIPC